jgi:GntR family transcriptional regulator, transcriptional repressor for pyruvate dehydrogenase complex
VNSVATNLFEGDGEPVGAPSRAAEKLAYQLAALLLEAHFPDGTVLSPENELMKTLQCSRTALRGALRLLETWGLITVQPGRNGGPITRSPQADDLRPALSALIHSRQASLADLLAAHRAIDPFIAAEAARLRSEDDLVALHATIAVASEAVGSRDIFLAATAQFYRDLASAAGLTVLGVFLSALMSVGAQTVNRVAPDNETLRLRMIRGLERVVDAVQRSDPKAAEEAMAGYALESELFWRQYAPHFVDVPLRPLAFMDW